MSSRHQARHRARRNARHSRLPAAVAGWLLVTTGVVMVAIAQTQSGGAGAVTASAFSAADQADVALTTNGAVAPPPGLAVGEPALLEPPPTADVPDEQVDPPATLGVPGIGVESGLQPLGLNDDGTLEVPTGSLYDQAGWYTGSPRPGEIGPSVLLGHVTGNGGQPSVFYRLSELRAGQQVTVDRDDGSVAQFEVYRVEQYPKDEFPTAAVYGDTAGAELRLITCAGVWDVGTGSHRDNIVVYAKLNSTT